MGRNIPTQNGYDLFTVASALQKAIRRGDIRLAGACAVELYQSGFWKYVWKRLLTISAEDCYGFATKEVWALLEGFMFVNDYKDKAGKGRIFISKAVVLLCDIRKSRESDHLQCLVVDKMSDREISRFINSLDLKEITFPEYTFDVHTRQGKSAGKTKREFFIDEFKGLNNRVPGLFDNVVEGL